MQRWRTRLPVQLSHVWQPDSGFRAAEIRNRAIIAARGDYCVFIDGDCIPRPDFVAAHRRLAQPGCFVTGTRVLLSRRLTLAVLQQGLRPETWTGRQWIAHCLRGDVNRLFKLLRLPIGSLRRLAAGRWAGARSCNLAIWRADLDRVDGFDASFCGWGREDSDLLIRLLRAGVRARTVALRSALFTCGTRTPTVPNWLRMTRGLRRCWLARACARGADCRQCGKSSARACRNDVKGRC